MTPAELFLNWKPRTKLTQLNPNLQAVIEKKREKPKETSDKLRGPSRSFCEGQKVFVKTVRNEKVSWIPGKILTQRSPVTYLVSMLGKTRFCHADHLRAQANISPGEERKTSYCIDNFQSRVYKSYPRKNLQQFPPLLSIYRAHLELVQQH